MKGWEGSWEYRLEARGSPDMAKKVAGFVGLRCVLFVARSLRHHWRSLEWAAVSSEGMKDDDDLKKGVHT